MSRIRSYLLNVNVQLGATYNVSKSATDTFGEGYKAAAKFINASAEEVNTPALLEERLLN